MSEAETFRNEDYPLQPTTFPIVWNGFGRMSLPPRFAFWIPERHDFQIVDVDRSQYPSFILTNTRTERRRPFYFARSQPDATVRMIRIHKPRATKNSEIDLLTWFTGGWLCRRNDVNRLQAIIPIMAFSDTSKLPFQGNVGICPTAEFDAWVHDQSVDGYKQFIRRCLLKGSNTVYGEKSAKHAPIPEFVCRALIREAIEKGDTCPISLTEFSHTMAISVTSCYHLFEQEALDQWLHSHSSCPVCKQVCSSTTVAAT